MQNILNTIGNTPLIKIEKLSPNPKVKIFAKLEGSNPTGSIKDRIALAMIEKAEKQGILVKGKTIIEPTSGNTGISFAMVSAIKGYKLIIVMPESMSVERRQMIKAFGAELILVKPEEWRDAAIKFTKSLVEKDSNLVLLNQFENEANFQAHYETTGKEILDQMNGEKIDYLVAGLGTGGTITGIAKRLKERFPEIKVIGVQPKQGSKIEGLKSIKDGYVPPVMNLKIMDEIMEVDQKQAFESTRELAEKEGIFAGPSSGTALFVSQEIAKKIDSGNIVTLFPDRGERYLSTDLFLK
jgi:cysteine synthase B